MSNSLRPEIDYADLEYLACVEDQSHVNHVIKRLSDRGIPVRVQSVSVRSTNEAPNCTYRIFVPQTNIDVARNIALNGYDDD
jgi:hypothetical protein